MSLSELQTLEVQLLSVVEFRCLVFTAMGAQRWLRLS